jgi:hypothetical protein
MFHFLSKPHATVYWELCTSPSFQADWANPVWAMWKKEGDPELWLSNACLPHCAHHLSSHLGGLKESHDLLMPWSRKYNIPHKQKVNNIEHWMKPENSREDLGTQIQVLPCFLTSLCHSLFICISVSCYRLICVTLLHIQSAEHKSWSHCVLSHWKSLIKPEKARKIPQDAQ